MRIADQDRSGAVKEDTGTGISILFASLRLIGHYKMFAMILNAFVTKRQTDRPRREAFGVRRIPALCESSAPREAKAPEYGALQTLRAIWLRLGQAWPPCGQTRLPFAVSA